MFRRRGLLYAIPLLMDWALFLIVFAVSRRMADTESGMLEMGLVGAILSSCHVVSSIVGGRLSDRIGRRRMMFCGSLSFVLCPLLAAWGWYGLTYAALGIGSGMMHPPIIALLTEGRTHGRARSAISHTLIVYCVSWNIGLISGQMSGGWLYSHHEQLPLSAALVVGLIITLCIALIRKPAADGQLDTTIMDNDLKDHQDLAASFARLSRISNVGGAVSMSMIVYLFPNLAVAMDIPPDEHGLIVSTTRLLVIAIYLIMHLSSFWHFRFSVALTSQLIAMGGLVVLAHAENRVTIWLALAAAVQLIGYNFFSSLYYSTAGSVESQRGASSGWHEASLAMGFAVGAALGGWIGEQRGVRAPYLLAAGVILVLAVVQIVVFTQQVKWRRRPRGRRPESHA